MTSEGQRVTGSSREGAAPGTLRRGRTGGGRHGRGAPVADGRVTGSRNCKQVGRGGRRGGVPAGTSAIPIPNQPRFLNPQTFREQHRTINAMVDIPTLVQSNIRVVGRAVTEPCRSSSEFQYVEPGNSWRGTPTRYSPGGSPDSELSDPIRRLIGRRTQQETNRAD